MDFRKDIGRFVTLSYKALDGSPKLAMGRLDIDEFGFLVFYNVKFPDKVKKVNPAEITIVDYSAEPIEVRSQ